MKSLNSKRLEKGKSKKDSKLQNGSSWFSLLRKSFGSRKTSEKIKDVDKYQSTLDTNSCNSVCIENFNSKNLYIYDNDDINYSDDFLDAFSCKNNEIFHSDYVKNKIQCYSNSQSQQNHKDKYRYLLDKLCHHISENPPVVENILLLVVEDYITSTCEKMLQDKMKSVFRKIQILSRNQITKPGLRKNDISKSGGNITQFDDIKESKSKNLNILYRNDQKHLIDNRILRKINENIRNSTNLHQNVGERVKSLTANRRPTNSNSNFDNFQTYCVSNKDPEHSSETSNNLSNDISQNSQIFKRPLKTENCLKISEIKASKPGNSKTRAKSNQQNIKYKESRLKTVYKASSINLTPKFKDKSGDNVNLIITKIVDIDIKPEKENKILTNCPVFSADFQSYCKKEMILKTKDDGIYEELNSNYNEKISKSKIRRSVTFLEPRKNHFNSPLKKNPEFLSQVEINSHKFSQQSLGKFNKTDNTQVDLLKSPKSNCQSSQYSTLKMVQNYNNNSSKKSYLFVNNKLLPKHNSNSSNNKVLSPTIISIRSTPTNMDYPQAISDGDKWNYENFKKQNFRKINYDSQTNLRAFLTESQINLSTATSDTVVDNDKSEATKNYSVIEIINKSDLGIKSIDGDENNSNSDYNNIRFNNNDVSYRSCLSTCMESFMNSSKASLNEIDDPIIIADTEDFEQPKCQLVTLTEDDSNDCLEQFNSFLRQKSHLLSQIKTANFSSSTDASNHEEIKNNEKNNKNIHYSFLNCVSNNKHSEPNSSISESVNCETVESNNVIRYATINNGTDLHKKQIKPNSIFKHTVASKQKIRDKVKFKETIDTKNSNLKSSKGFVKKCKKFNKTNYC